METSKYQDRFYFKLDYMNCTIVNKVEEEMYLSTRFLLLSSDKIHASSKQEFWKQNDQRGRRISQDQRCCFKIPVVLWS